MNSCEFVHFISSLACIISQNTSEDELVLLATFFTQLGDTLSTLSAARLNFSDNNSCLNSNLNSNAICDTPSIDLNNENNENNQNASINTGIYK